MLTHRHSAQLDTIARMARCEGMTSRRKRLSENSISVRLWAQIFLFSRHCHGKNTQIILSYFFKKRSIVSQPAVTDSPRYSTTRSRAAAAFSQSNAALLTRVSSRRDLRVRHAANGRRNSEKDPSAEPRSADHSDEQGGASRAEAAPSVQRNRESSFRVRPSYRSAEPNHM